MPTDEVMLSKLIEALQQTESSANKKLQFPATFAIAFRAFLWTGKMNVKEHKQSSEYLLMIQRLKVEELSVTILSNIPFLSTLPGTALCAQHSGRYRGG